MKKKQDDKFFDEYMQNRKLTNKDIAKNKDNLWELKLFIKILNINLVLI